MAALEGLAYKELQALAKQQGISARQKVTPLPSNGDTALKNEGGAQCHRREQ
jgi:hypothetical protein